MPCVKLFNVCKSFHNKPILNKVKIKINKGEFISLFGPNGCGKTTLLNIIAGVLKLNSGTVLIDGKLVDKQKIGYVFQNYRDSLLPWKTNLENIAFPLELEGIRNRVRKVQTLVKNLKLNIPLSNYPYQSSGGEQQLVALLREVIAKPKIILMDEPFSALDHESRNFFKNKVQIIWKKLGLTILFVSHDLSEAIQLGDKLIVMNSGKIKKVIKICLPRPRPSNIVFTKKFLSLQKKIQDIK